VTNLSWFWARLVFYAPGNIDLGNQWCVFPYAGNYLVSSKQIKRYAYAGVDLNYPSRMELRSANAPGGDLAAR